MKNKNRVAALTLRLFASLLCFQLLSAASAFAQPPPAQGPGQAPVDPRVQIRSYRFEDTNEDLPYAVFVSSKVSADKKNPLIVALHGLGGSHLSLLRNNALELAEEGGYILVGPMGYNSRGWYGIPEGPRIDVYPAPAPRPQATQGTPPPAAQANNDPPNLRELSEKDVLNVLALIRAEFNVDENRTYLMGHSMGGAGTFHLGVKYPENWAAIAAIAPAAFWVDPQSLTRIPDMPVFLIHGAADTVVPVEVGRVWADTMKAQAMTYEYQEPVDGDHGNVIAGGMPGIFAFFGKHTKASP